MHQSANQTAYFLVRRMTSGAYAAVADIPRPASRAKPLREGDVVLGRCGERFDDDVAMEAVTATDVPAPSAS